MVTLKYKGNGLPGDYTLVRAEAGGEKIKVLAGDTVEVSDAIAKTLLKAYKRFFSIIAGDRDVKASGPLSLAEEGKGGSAEGIEETKPARKARKVAKE